jgi:hypothetical protein
LLNSCHVLLCFRAPFGVVAPPMILAIEVRIFWVVVRESWGSSASPPSSGIESSPGAWPVALFWLRVSDVVNVSQMLGWCPPCHVSVACLASFRLATLLRWSSSDKMYSSNSRKSSSTVLGFFLVRWEAVGPGVRPLISALIVVLSSASGI